MPAMHGKKKTDETQLRIRADFRVRAAAAGLAVGAASYALCAGVCTPLCLNAAWIASFSVFPACALAALFACRMLRRGTTGRLLCLFVLAAMLLCAAFLYAALVALVRETLLPLARISFVAQVTAVFLLLCCVSGQKGAMRLSFALRVFLPPALLLLASRSAAKSGASGLFPLLGMGAGSVGMAALAMLPAALPALMLALPQEYRQGEDANTPGAGFFILRLWIGAGTATALLVLLSVCNPYESILLQNGWGERMIILSSGAPRDGIAGTLLTLLQALSFALGAVNALLCAGQAARLLVGQLFKRRKKR